jgi:succinate dehydrogenase / fumarate reductase flavoprotein subunit
MGGTAAVHGATVLVAGAGMAGLAAALSALEAGARVVLLSRQPATRSPGAAFRGGLNAAADQGGIEAHIADALACGGPGASAAAARARCEAAAGIAAWLAERGVPFDRDADGLQRSSFPGASRPRTLGAGASLGRQILHTLDGQARRFEAEGRLERADGWHLAELALDGDGACRGVAAVDLRSAQVRAFPADAVILASGGAGHLFRPSTGALDANGALLGLAHRHGARLRDADRLVWTDAVPGTEKDLAVPPFLIANGATTGDGGLDLRPLGKALLKRWGGGFPRLAAAFSGRNPAGQALPLRRAVAGTLGGLRVTEDMATDIPNLFAAGAAACAGWGARTLPGDEALAWLHGGLAAGRAAARASRGEDASAGRAADALLARLHGLHTAHAGASPIALFDALTEILSAALAAGATPAEAAGARLAELASRAEAGLWVKDRNWVANAALAAALDFPSSLAWARSAAASAAFRASQDAEGPLDAAWNDGGPAVTAGEAL